jgi:hypothetical protein
LAAAGNTQNHKHGKTDEARGELNVPADQSTAYNQMLFAKLHVLEHYLKKWDGVYEYIFWNDADSFFLNMTVSVPSRAPLGVEVCARVGLDMVTWWLTHVTEAKCW